MTSNKPLDSLASVSERVMELCGAFGAVVRLPHPAAPGNVLDRIFSVYVSRSGDLPALFNGALSFGLDPIWRSPIVGAGTDLDDESAKRKAICETAERYSASILLEGDFKVASATELAETAFDWTCLPKLSSSELAMPGQMFRNFDPTALMRWIPTWELVSGTTRWLPSAMTHLYPRLWTSERFWSPISTGLAVHTDITLAILSGIAEVIERDAIALTWLLRRPLSRICFSSADLTAFPPAIAGLLALEEYRVYDATTEFGLPIVYLHRHRPGHPFAANIVTCAATFTFESAVRKVLQEVASVSCLLDSGNLKAKDSPEECSSIEDGAIYMGRPERSGAFAFLSSDSQTVDFANLRASVPLESNASPIQQLQWLRKRASALGHKVYLAELTADELRDVGLRCVRAVIPSLMPMSTMMRCRYLDARRLVNAMHAWGLPGSLRERLNLEPQPFA